MIKIKYNRSGYPVGRNILHIDHPKMDYIHEHDLLRYPHYFLYKLGYKSSILANSHYSIFNPKKEIRHFYNSVSFSKAPWISTFETRLPRWKTELIALQKIGIKLLASDNCKKLIAMSDTAKMIQHKYVEEHFPDYQKDINPKIQTLYPPQKQIIRSYDEKEISSENIVLTMVGNAFFRKGGLEILKVFDRLTKKHLPIHLNVMSSLIYGDHATQSTKKDRTKAEKMIKRNPFISHYHSVPNEKVLEILKKTHVAMLPSYAETFGFAVLEAQAAGCPVITTDIRAFPEINNESCGWIINLPKYNSTNHNEFQRAIHRTESGRKQISDAIIEQLEMTILSILNKPDLIKEKGKKSLQRINEFHDPEKHAQKLLNIYEEAFLE